MTNQANPVKTSGGGAQLFVSDSIRNQVNSIIKNRRLIVDYKELSFRAGLAIDKLDDFIRKVGASASLESIRQQLIFIRDKAHQRKNPLNELESSKCFTYRILASKEFSSPEELEIKKCIDHISKILDPD